MPSIGDSLELTPKDLNKFNKKMTDEILDAQKNGWRGHVNRQGHVSMLAPDGKDTVVVSANANAVNQLLLGINRYRRRIGEKVDEAKEIAKDKASVPQKWPCARPTCPKVYATEEQLNIHIAVDHEKRIKCPDCNETFKAPNVVGRHRQLKHGYVSPHKAKRLEQEANRAKKKLNEEGKLTEEQREQIKTYLTKPEETTAVNMHEVLGMRTITAPMHQEIDEIRRDLGMEVTAGTLAHLMNDHAGTELPSPDDVKRLMEEGTMTKEEVQKLLHGSGESTGRDIQALMDGEGHNGAKFDPHFVHQMIANAPTEPIMDSMDEKSLITGKEHSLKNFEGNPLLRDRQDVVDGVIKDVLEGKLPNGYSDELPLEVLDSDEVFQLQDMKEEDRAVAIDEIHQHVSLASSVSAADIYRETTKTLKRATETIKQPNSITLDLEQIMDMDIRSVARVLKAAGMSLKLSSVPKED